MCIHLCIEYLNMNISIVSSIRQHQHSLYRQHQTFLKYSAIRIRPMSTVLLPLLILHVQYCTVTVSSYCLTSKQKEGKDEKPSVPYACRKLNFCLLPTHIAMKRNFTASLLEWIQKGLAAGLHLTFGNKTFTRGSSTWQVCTVLEA